VLQCAQVVYNPVLMKRVREILRNEYIGAIAIGFLLAQSLGGIISVILQPIITYIQTRGRPSSIFAAAPKIINWPQLILGVISVVLYLLFAMLLFVWIYPRKQFPAAYADAPAESPAAPADKPGEAS